MDTPATPSRPRTPSNSIHHRLLRPALSTKPSSASLHASASLQPMLSTPSPMPPQSSSSSASGIAYGNVSIINADDLSIVDQEEPDGVAEGDFASDVQAQKHLRDQLRRTLTHQSLNLTPQTSHIPECAQTSPTQIISQCNRQYYVITNAGKPVFSYRSAADGVATSGDEDDDTTTIAGVIQAIISVFADSGDKLKSLCTDTTRITFLLKPNLYFVGVGPAHETESWARIQLEYLSLQITSICTASQIKKMFQRRANFDLQNLLQGSTSLIESLAERMKHDLGIAFSSLSALRMDPTLRNQCSEMIVPSSKLKDILYIIIIARNEVVTLSRPRKHSIHPADFHILLNTMGSASLKAASETASGSWLPICLPKYNPDGFTHTYVSFLRPEIDLSLLCVCGASDFEAVTTWLNMLTEKMQTAGMIRSLESACSDAHYSPGALSIPGLFHFVYKSKLHIQSTAPIYEEPYDTLAKQQRLLELYHLVYDSMHARSGQSTTLRLQFISTNQESILGWITQPFELYMAISPSLSKNAAVAAANTVAKWVRREDSRLFIKDAPVF